MLSLRTWARGLAVTSTALIVAGAAVLVVDELQARRTRDLLEGQWAPAATAQVALRAAEVRAIASVQASVRQHTAPHVAKAVADVRALVRALERARVPDAASGLVDLDHAARAAASAWLTTVAEPALSERQASVSTEHVLLAGSMLDSAQALGSTLDELRTRLRDSLDRTETLLRSTIAIETLLLTFVLVAMLIGTERRVLRPVLALRADLDRAAREHAHVIRAQGPPELAAVGTDAEHLRRTLVLEHDAAEQRAAALEQGAPITTAIRAELDQADRGVPGIHGFHRPIEGVIAGDWWWAGQRVDGARLLAVADVSGHGVAAGVMALQTQAIVSAALAAGLAPDEVARLACDRPWPAGMFATLFLGVVQHDRIEYCSAGHPFALLLDVGAGTDLEVTGPVISGLGGRWACSTAHLPPRRACLVATDGLLEASEHDDLRRWAVQAWRAADGDGDEALALMTAQAREHSRTWSDDITAVLVTGR